MVCRMTLPHEMTLEIPDDLAACQALLRAQAELLARQAEQLSQQGATIESQSRTLEELAEEMEKLRKLLSHFVNGHRSEKRILSGPNQAWLPFDNSEEFQAARAEAEAEAETIVQTYTVNREVNQKKIRDAGLPSHLRRVEQIIEGDASLQTCATHGLAW